jgi:hypothetical protein
VYIRIRQDRAQERESVLNSKTYSRRDEKRILDVLGRGLLKDFPNPERIGCPGADVLKKITSHEMPLSEAEKWLDHLGSCSPCYADFKRFREAFERQRRQRWLAAAAGILLAVGVLGWALLHKRNESFVAQTAVLDLRDRSVARGGEPTPGEQPLEISRGVKRLSVYLPLGSAEGPYEIRIAMTAGSRVFATSGVASVKDGVTSIQAVIDLSSASSGQYVFQFRRPDSEWNSYPLMLR